MISQLRYGTHTSQTFWGYDDSHAGGVFGVLVDGVAYSGETMSSSNGYTGIVTVTGLSGQHTYQATLDGVAVDDAKTFHTIPQTNYKVAIWGCSQANSSTTWANGDNPGFNAMRRLGVDAHICLGDYYYIAPTFNMLGIGAINNLGTYASELPKYRLNYQYQVASSVSRHQLMERTPFVGMMDNHEIYSGAGTSEHGGPSVGSASTLYDAAHRAAWEFFLKGRPVTLGSADTLPEDGVLYTTWKWGNVDFITMDRVTYQDVSFGLGANQIAWVVSAIQSSTAEFLVITSPTMFRATPTDYQTIMAAADALNKTVCAICSDFHYMDTRFIQGSYMPNKGMLQFGFNPLYGDNNTYADTLAGNSTVRFGPYDGSTDKTQGFALLEVSPGQIIVSAINSRTGQKMASFTLNAGERDATNSIALKS